MHGDDFIGLLAVLIIFGGPITYFIINRLFTHNERMEMLKRGMIPPEDLKKGRVYGAPYAGVPPQPMQPMYYPDMQAQAALRKGISISAVGFALTFGLSFIGFGPWLIGGLVPLFVGIAQIIIAVMSGAQFGPTPRMQSFGSPPPHVEQPAPPPYANSSSTAGPAPTGPPYGWRPPSGVPEIERGPKPPDVK
jgi:hypothetical protein